MCCGATKPVHLNHWACNPVESKSCNCWSPQAKNLCSTREATSMGSPHTAMKTQCSQRIIMVHSPESCWEDCNYLHSPLLAPRSCHLWGRIRIAKSPPNRPAGGATKQGLFFCSVAKSCPTCDTMDCRMPGFPVLYSFQSLFKLVSIESVMLSNHLILCCPVLLFSNSKQE